MPGGVKSTDLVEHGQVVINPALPDEVFDEAVRIAQELGRRRPDITFLVVESSGNPPKPGRLRPGTGWHGLRPAPALYH